MRTAAVLLAVALAPTTGAAADTMAHERAERSVADLRPEVVIRGGFYAGLFASVTGVHCDRFTGEILVVDQAAGAIEIFDERGAPLFAFSDDEHLRQPSRVAADREGRILVLDADRARVKVFSYRGDFLETFEPGGFGVETPTLTALAIDRNGDLFLGDSRSGQVIAYGPDRKPRLRVGSFGDGPGRLDGIVGIALDEKNVYVASQEGVAVHVFTRQGRYVRSWGYHDAGVHNVSLPAGIAVDEKGRVVLLDTLRQEIKYFDAGGRLIDLFGGLGKQPGAVAYPTDLSMDRSGRLCVADAGNRRVQLLSPVEATPKAEEAGSAEPRP